MQKKLLVAALGTLFAMPVLAEDAPAAAAPAAAPTPAVTSNVALVTNYLYRGISQTGAKPAIQGGFDYAHASGFYAGVWGSSISWLSDATIATNAGLELDTYLGFKNSFATDYSYDVGYLRYNYPGNYAASATKGDTDEIYGLIGYKWITAKYSYSLGNTFGAPDARGTNYFDLSASYPVGDSGVTLGAHYGKQSYKGSSAAYKAFVTAEPSYSDYKLSVTKDFSGYVVGLAYSNTNAKKGVGQFYNVLGKDLGTGTAVLSVTRTF
jgi:uncharacterized protein (TIGR02001 family)